MHGHLGGLGLALGSYHKRYFVLMTQPRCSLVYFKDESRREVKGSLFLEHAAVRLSMAEAKSGKPKGKKKFAFVLTGVQEDTAGGADGVIDASEVGELCERKFYCTSRAEREAWMKKFEVAFKGLKVAAQKERLARTISLHHRETQEEEQRGLGAGTGTKTESKLPPVVLTGSADGTGESFLCPSDAADIALLDAATARALGQRGWAAAGRVMDEISARRRPPLLLDIRGCRINDDTGAACEEFLVVSLLRAFIRY